MSKRVLRILCLIMSAILVLGLITGALATIVSAATNTYQLVNLLSEGKIKPLGRTQANTSGDGITANWSGNGFEMNVNSNGGDFVIGYKTNVNNGYAAVLVDGVQVWRGALYGTGTITVPLSAGKHTVSAIREHGHTNSTSAYIHFTTVKFDGTIEAKPANKSLYIEVVGDSYACGAGSAADYAAGVQWGDSDHTAQGAFGWYLAKMLNADLSIVARGGIGLFDGTSEQEGTPNTVTMRDIYPYASGHNQTDGLYDFARKPDLVVIELGANDGIKNSDPTKSISNWAAKLREMISLVRAKNGADTKILLLSHNSTKYLEMLKIADADENIWACHFSHHGNGSAALDTQYEGHPSADDEYEIAEALYKTIQDNRILGYRQTQPTYNDIVYYVSESGNDANDGKTIGTAKKTVKSAWDKAVADNKTFANGSRLVFRIQGTVQYSTTGDQGFMAGTKKTADGKNLPILVTTYNYNGTKAILDSGIAAINDGHGDMVIHNSVTFKDITFQSTTRSDGQFRHRNLHTGYGDVVFDNVTFAHAGAAPAKNNSGWRIGCGTGFGSDPHPTTLTHSTVTFKNGDYTNLDFASAVLSNSMWKADGDIYSLPTAEFYVIIEEGARMGTVYGAWGTLAVAGATVELNGGTVEKLYPTWSAPSDSPVTYNTNIKTIFNGGKLNDPRFMGTGAYNTINGDVTVEFKRGQYIGTLFTAVGNNTTVNGNVTNNISGGEIRLNPTSTTTGSDGIYLGGYYGLTINGALVNNISGGELNLIYNANVDCGIYLGIRGGSLNGNQTNNISGGNLMAVNGTASAKSSGIYLGAYSGNISGTLTNNVTGGTLDGGVNFGDRTIGNRIGKIVNILGVEGSLQGPRIFSGVNLGGGWAYLGNYVGNRQLTAADCSDTVVLDTTIYGGYYSGAVYAGVNGSAYDTTHSYVSGSVKTNIYGGYFPGGFYGTSGAAVAGHVTTNIYGGTFTSIYGTRSATVFDGVETNIYAMKEYYAVKADNTYGIWAGGNTGKVSAKTEGCDAVKLTIAPKKNEDVLLRTPVYAGFAGDGSATGTTTVTVSGGIYPKGFKVGGKTVGEVLASGYSAYNHLTGAKLSYASGDASVSGYAEIRSGAPAAARTLSYYVRPNGNNSNDGTTFISAKKTIKAAIDQAVADNGGSRVFPNGTKLVVYVDGTVYMSTGQNMGYGYLLTTADGKHMETVLTTYNYNGTMATIVQDHTPTNSGSSSICMYTDITLKDVAVVAKKTSGGFVTQRVFASGCTLTLDNASLKTDCGVNWVVAADYFSLGGIHPLNTPETYGTVVFKNGDYTDLAYVSAVYSNSIWRSDADGGSVTSVPGKHCKIVVEDGAKLKNVYNTYGTLAVESATVEIRGGEVARYYGTSGAAESAAKTYNTSKIELIVSGGNVDLVKGTGDSKVQVTYDATDKTKKTNVVARELTVNSELVTTISGGTVGAFEGTGFGVKDSYKNAENKTVNVSSYVKINGNVTNTFSGGTIGGKTFFPLNDYTQLTGNLTNTFSGAKLEINPTSTTNGGHGIFMSGRSVVTINGNVTNNITAGSVGVLYEVTNIKSGIYLSLRDGWINGDLTNNISGGEIYTKAASDAIVPSYASIHFSAFSGGSVKGTLYNNISGGTFTGAKGAYYLGQQGVSGSIGKVVNVIGDQITGTGPVFNDLPVYLGGGWGRLGVNNNSGTLPTTYTDNVVLSSTIYGGTFENSVYNGVNSTTGDNVTYIKGSVEANIYGGSFTAFYGSCKSPVYGHATTNIYGGSFNSVYGALTGQVYDGVELNIFGMTEGSAPTGIWAAGTTSKISVVTEGRDAVKLTIDPKTELTLSMPISAGCSGTGTVTGTTSALVTGGTYTNGFAVAGLKVKDVLADGLVPLKTADNTIVAVTNDMTSTGTDSVTLVTTAWTAESATVTLSKSSVGYDGKNNAEVPTETVKFYNTTLVKDTDYTVSYSRDGQATTDLNSFGTVTVTVTAKAPYSGTLSTTYTIVRDSAVGDAIADVTQRTAAYDSNTVTADDSADLAELKSDIKAILTDNASVLTEEEKTALNGLTTTVEGLEKAISIATTDLNTLGHRISEYDIATVTADDASWLKMLETALDRIKDSNLTAAQKARKQELKANLAALNAQIDDVAAMMADTKEELAKYTAATVTADHSAALTELAADIAAIPNGNLTAAQKTEKQNMANQVTALQKVITDTAAEIAWISAASASFDAATLKAEDAAALAALKARTDAIADGNLTAAQKITKQNVQANVAHLQSIFADVANELAAVKTEVAKYSADSVTADSSVKLQTLANRIAAISDTMLSSAQKAEKKAAADKVAALQKVITDTADELAAVKTEVAKYTTASESDAAALQALSERIAAIPDGNLTTAQKNEKKTAADKVAALLKSIGDVTAELNAVKAEAAEVDASTATADDTAALKALADRIAAIPEGNLTAAQKTDKQAAANKVAAAQQAIAEAKTKLDEAKAAADAISTKATADDSEALAAAAAKLAAVPTGNLTAAQKTQLQTATEKVTQLQKTIADIASTVDTAKEALKDYDAASVTADDNAALETMAAKLSALPTGNMTEQQKTDAKAAADSIAALQKVIADAAADLAEAKDEVAKLDAATVTADDTAKLDAIKAQLAEAADGNLTAAQKTAKQEAANKAAALEKVITDTAKALADAKEEADKFDPNTVNSENSEALAAVAAQIEAVKDDNLTAAQKSEKKAAAEAVTAMQKTITDVATDLAAQKAAVEAFDPAAVTSADKEALTALKKQLQDYPNDHLTEAEKAAKEQQIADVQAMLDTIAKAEEISGNIDAVAQLLADKNTATVTSADAAEINAAANAITELKKDTSLTDADKQKLAQLEAKAAALQEQLEKADAADEVPDAVDAVKPENVEPEDKADLKSAIEALEKALETYGSNYTDAEKKAIEDAKTELQTTLAVIEEVEAVQAEIAQLPTSAEPDDEAAINALAAALASFDEMNDRQKSMITAAELAKLEALAQSLRDYRIIKGDKSEWTQSSGKDATFTVNGLHSKFEGLQVDGSTVDPKYYTTKSGSTIITLTDEFLDKLAKGEHTITAVYTDGKVTGTFTVKAKSASPETGDSTNVVLLSMLALMSVASAAAITIGMKKRAR